MSQLLVVNATIVLSDRVIKGHSVLCDNGRITRIAPATKFQAIKGIETIDAAGKYLAPGFIDLHIHGAHEFLIDNGADDLSALCKLLPHYGVTGFCRPLPPCPRVRVRHF